MKRYVITLATATAMATPAAVLADNHTEGPDLYGRVHLSLNGVNTRTGSENTGVGISSNASRFGIRGSEELNDRVTGIYQLELGLSWAGNSSSTIAGGNYDSIWDQVRDSYVGVEGDFGTLRAGRLPAANQYVYDSNYLMDTIADVGVITHLGIGGRFDTALQYDTPDAALGPFAIKATYAPAGYVEKDDDGNITDNKANEDNLALRGSFADGPWHAGLSVMHLGASGADPGDDSYNVYTLGGGYSHDSGTSIGALFGARDHDGEGVEKDDQFAALGGALPVTQNGSLKAQLVQFMGDEEESDATTVGGGYYYTMSQRTELYGVAAYTRNDENRANHTYGYGHGGLPQGVDGVGSDADTYAASIGLRHDF
ncbi:MAG: porin [Halorhodospira sp.]